MDAPMVAAMIAVLHQPASALVRFPASWRAVCAPDFSARPGSILRRASGSRIIEFSNRAEAVDGQRFANRLFSPAAAINIRESLTSRSRTTHEANRRNCARTRRGAVRLLALANSGTSKELSSDSRRQEPSPRTTGISGTFTNASRGRLLFCVTHGDAWENGKRAGDRDGTGIGLFPRAWETGRDDPGALLPLAFRVRRRTRRDTRKTPIFPFSLVFFPFFRAAQIIKAMIS